MLSGKKFGFQIIFMTLSLLCLQMAAPYIFTMIDDVPIEIDAVLQCPVNTLSCQVTKKNDIFFRDKILHKMTCFDRQDRVLAELKMYERAQPNVRVNITINTYLRRPSTDSMLDSNKLSTDSKTDLPMTPFNAMIKKFMGLLYGF